MLPYCEIIMLVRPPFPCPRLRCLPGLVHILTSVVVVNVFCKPPIDELLPLIERLANKVWIEFQRMPRQFVRIGLTFEEWQAHNAS